MSEFSKKEQKLLLELLSRFMQCTRNEKIYLYKLENPFDDKYLKHNIYDIYDTDMDNLSGQVICIYDDGTDDEIGEVIRKYEQLNYIILISNSTKWDGYSLDFINSSRKISFLGKTQFDKTKIIPKDFSVLAIIHLFNEADVIEKTTNYLLAQGVDVYLVDNWSTDESSELVVKLSKENPNRVFYEKFPQEGKTKFYEWYNQLERTEEISKKLNYDWYIHYDADEYRMSPWKNVTLREALFYIDSLGYNEVENTVVDFKITKKSATSIFMTDTWFDFGHRPAHFEQTKTWKKCLSIDLKSSGGHIAKIDEPKIFPLKILNRHYPLRSFAHACKKIFDDRKPRFAKENKERGWHGHYNSMVANDDVISSIDNLILWNSNTNRELYVPLFTGCGIEVEKNEFEFVVDSFSIQKDEHINIYGAGKVGQFMYKKLAAEFYIEHWVDGNFERIAPMYGRIIENPKTINNGTGKIIIAIESESVATEVKEMLIKNDIDKERILWNQVKKV